MGKRKFWTGVIGGAIVGGIVALFDKEARSYAKQKCADMKATSSHVIKNPSSSIRQLQSTFEQMSEKLNNQAENAINAIEQVEDTIVKVTGKGINE
ncbi:MAG TPA: YtxH domain-containing protein [Cerasibacillus sp.]|uniref:YtxH domain-containing protein n=1 Tax=Cerasibacillus sp. TaxID=2498711 RepID=UPI002F3ED122